MHVVVKVLFLVFFFYIVLFCPFFSSFIVCLVDFGSSWRLELDLRGLVCSLVIKSS